ncbi:MAG TPA: hypothetical protein DCY13_10795 [Verrucomicrobiales bacterium]|nr:hypothetical protein [Verrucomicrobiales bacterium]
MVRFHPRWKGLGPICDGFTAAIPAFIMETTNGEPRQGQLFRKIFDWLGRPSTAHAGKPGERPWQTAILLAEIPESSVRRPRFIRRGGFPSP